MEAASRLLVEVMDELGVQRCAVVGYSMGGRLALYFALRRPERCESLFLESASPGLKTERERAARRASDEEKAKSLGSGDFEGFLERWYRQPLFASLHGGLIESLIERRKDNEPCDLAKSLRGMGAGGQPSLWDEIKDLRVPTLAVAGKFDEKFVGISERMSEASASIRPAIVPDAGHNVRLEVPETYLSLLEGFLNPS